MPNNRALAATRVAAASTTSNRFAFRITASVLFTFLDAAVLATYGSTLYHAASGNPLLLLGLGLLAMVLLGSLPHLAPHPPCSDQLTRGKDQLASTNL